MQPGVATASKVRLKLVQPYKTITMKVGLETDAARYSHNNESKTKVDCTTRLVHVQTM